MYSTYKCNLKRAIKLTNLTWITMERPKQLLCLRLSILAYINLSVSLCVCQFRSTHKKNEQPQWGGVSSHRQSRFKQATWSLDMFICLHRSFRYTCYACSLHSQARSLYQGARSLRSLPRGTLKFIDMCSCWKRIQRVFLEQGNVPLQALLDSKLYL